ncbi:putative cystathionine gamma-synthase [Rosellinia necatrix]|uniref:Putative cystathionine gamma-synthase n=1 Tax=Rosellinia necatrix TaxID=77044 RepID=A0A1W2TGT6_ROSNE|nr:putative cystathionine gamma-synthase [Rosellinia necatrix]
MSLSAVDPSTLCQSIGQKLPLPDGYGCCAFVSRDAWASSRAHAASAFRKEQRLEAAELRHHVVELAGTRLYVVGFPRAKAGAATFEWQHGGRGFSARAAEALLPHLDSLVHVGEFPDPDPDPDAEGEGIPEPTFLPEGDSHGAVRERVAGLLMRACAADHASAVAPGDVFLYQTGMAAVARLHDAVAATLRRAGPVVVFGAVFHSSYHLFEESAGGLRHYGRAADDDVDDFESYLEGGGPCAYVFTEFPSNPILVSVDLMRLRRLADKYGFFLAVDDTCASFANIDVLAAADVVVTSLTKAFSGYADVMAGSLALNPNRDAASYAGLKRAVSAGFGNELFEGDAARLLANSADYLARCAVHGRNAAALAAYFRALALDPASPVARVWYPPYSPGSAHLAPFLRRPAPDYPAPGYGCLLSVEFGTVAQAAAFYDALNFFHGPHLGAHLTLAVPYNALVYGKDKPEVHAAYGLAIQQIRIAVGLEDQEVLLSRCAEALSKVPKMG